MRVTKAMLQQQISFLETDNQLQSQGLQELLSKTDKVSAELRSTRESATSMLVTIGALKNALRYAGEAIKTSAEAISVK